MDLRESCIRIRSKFSGCGGGHTITASVPRSMHVLTRSPYNGKVPLCTSSVSLGNTTEPPRGTGNASSRSTRIRDLNPPHSGMRPSRRGGNPVSWPNPLEREWALVASLGIEYPPHGRFREGEGVLLRDHSYNLPFPPREETLGNPLWLVHPLRIWMRLCGVRDLHRNIIPRGRLDFHLVRIGVEARNAE